MRRATPERAQSVQVRRLGARVSEELRQVASQGELRRIVRRWLAARLGSFQCVDEAAQAQRRMRVHALPLRVAKLARLIHQPHADGPLAAQRANVRVVPVAEWSPVLQGTQHGRAVVEHKLLVECLRRDVCGLEAWDSPATGRDPR